MLDTSPLFQPGRIGSMTVKNRLVFPAMSSKLALSNGAVSEDYIAFFEAKARGGVGMLVIENTCVDWPQGKSGGVLTRLDSNEFMPALHLLAERMHAYGVKIGTQPQHVGRQTRLENTGGLPPLAPSVIPPTAGASQPREITVEEIDQVIEKYAEAARRTKGAGLDFTELHGAHGYLITQFLSPYMNRRVDRYGGSFENRLRFALELVARVRAKVGPDFPILFRFSADEHLAAGLTPEEGVAVAVALERAGVDALNVTSGVYESLQWIFPPMAVPDGYNVELAAMVKRAVNIPVIVVGKLGNAELASSVVREGKADFVALGRPLVADPLLPRKWAAGAVEAVVPCICCNECISGVIKQWPIRCAVNPTAGRERVARRSSISQRPGKMLVVGAGPAGMQATLTLAAAGYEVTLCDQQRTLGGSLRLAALPPHKDILLDLLRSFEHRLGRFGDRLKLDLGAPITVEYARSLAPDAIVVAAGAQQDTSLAASGPGVFSVAQALTQPHLLGRKVLVAGGGQCGCEVAEFLAARGIAVTILEQLSDIALDMEPIARGLLMERLAALGVVVYQDTRVQEVTAASVRALLRNEEVTLSADAVVLAAGWKPNDALVEKLRAGLCVPVIAVGDCAQPSNIMHAVHDGFNVIEQLSIHADWTSIE